MSNFGGTCASLTVPIIFPGGSGVSLKEGSFGRRGFKERFLVQLHDGWEITDGLTSLANMCDLGYPNSMSLPKRWGLIQ